MTDNGLIVASNRGPVSWRRHDDDLVPQRGFGGLVTALGGALQQEPGTWVSVAMSDEDRKVAGDHPDEAFDVEASGSTFRLRLLDVGERYDAYYNRVANRQLWFTVHALWDTPYEPDGAGWRSDWYDGYVPVNDTVAGAVIAEAGEDSEIYLQDYHLMTSGARVREALPEAKILHYLHTPWVGPADLRQLPASMVDELLRGLLAADVVGFSSPDWCDAFRECAAEILGAKVAGDAVVLDDERTVVADFVLGVDEEDLSSSAASDAAVEAGKDLDAERGGRRLVLRVDRTDLSKNILRGLQAYEVLLERHPEYRDTLWHYAHLNPSRQGVPAYRAYLEACRGVAERIRSRFGEQTLTVFVGDDYPRAVAALQRYDVLLANPVIDGTNLVAKEGPVLNTCDGVLVLSPYAGAAPTLGDAALRVNPYDVEDQADKLHAALQMDAAERAERLAALKTAARRGSPEEWFAAQRHQLRAAAARRR